MSEGKDFETQRAQSIQQMGENQVFQNLSHQWITHATTSAYVYNFNWLGVPIIQTPQDMVALQEIIWHTKPDLIIETGVARGGSLVLSASILHLLNGKGRVVGIDIDVRPHNRETIEAHPLAFRIHLIEGSSTDSQVIRQVKTLVQPNDRVMIILDSNHTHTHVLKELELYSPFVTQGCYLVVMDTVIEDMPKDFFPDRPWGKGDNPKTAVHEFLKETDRFEVDESIHNKLLITVAPDGYLRCVK